tara:strand:- start:435 stop:941 length:507 start_codon:yes stop_codon:yes gene_type:complete
MAVPNTGTLSQLAMAQEALYGTYGSGTVTGPISLYDMVNSGNTNGSGNSYPTVNTSCLPNPASRNAYVQFLQLRKYINNSLDSTATYYLNPSEAATPANIDNGDILYSNASLTTPVAAHSGTGNYYQQDLSNLTNAQKICDNNYLVKITTNGSGAMTRDDAGCYCSSC